MLGERTSTAGAVKHLEGIEGEVKWFDPRKGFGFIVGPEGQDIFAHYTVISGDGFRVLRDGAKVRYCAENTDRGWKATQVERLEDDDEPEVVVTRAALPARAARTPRR